MCTGCHVANIAPEQQVGRTLGDHQHGRLPRLRRAFGDADAVVFGHSHMPLHQRDGGFQIFNPGSPTERRRAPTRSMGLARVERGRVSFRHVALA